MKCMKVFTAKFWMMIFMALALPFALTGCDNAGDEMEDAADEVEDAAEGAADNVEDAADEVTDDY